ncbi:uncharacterized protein LOC143297945 isoform X2 [Babylonia areolata]|uniref:uncharacterized protein LOC143297945 isoform X2 n=1 Tax=Babylonia areolata TaxID=304850 RepID=UPI003FD11B24
MANYQQHQQPNTQFGQYYGYGSGSQYDSSNSQNKWGAASNTGNQSQISQNQNQQQMYQNAAQNYAAASGFYGNQNMYGQQQSYTGSGDSSMNVNGTRNTNSGTGNTSSTNTGSKATSSYNNASNTTGSTLSVGGGGGYSAGFGSGSAGFGSGGSYNSNATENKSTMNNVQNQMLGAAYGNTNQNTGITNSMASNVAMPATTPTQNFGTSATADTGSQFNQMSQMFGNGANYGAYTSGDTSGASISAGYNQAFNSGMMTLLQQTLMQQASGGGTYGMGTGNTNTWGMADGDGGFYAPPTESNYQSGGDMGGAGGKQGKKGKKWSGKDRQDFYGNRFAQMFTGMPGVLGQPQTGAGKGKRLMDGVRFNVKGEKVIDVEIPLTMYSRWGQLRKFFSKQDTEVAKHLIEFHDEMCEECLEREHGKKKKQDNWNEQVDEATVEAEETVLDEEDVMLRQVMGFGNFNTTREAMSEDNQADSTTGVCIGDTSAKSTTSTSWERAAGFIGPQKPKGKSQDSESEDTKNGGGPILSEEEKAMMNKLGWSVFNKKKNENGDEIDDDDNDDEEKMDDGGKDGTAAEGK